jgi:predicted alpha/beta superfamily hydrolase
VFTALPPDTLDSHPLEPPRMAITLRVHYPAQGRPLRLRTDADWDRDLEPAEVLERGDLLHFRVESEAPWFEFKACLEEPDGALRWSTGGNYVASAALPATHDVYPTFLESRGRITERIEVPGREGVEAHSIRVYVPPSYDENPYKRYPVAYMHDGTNLFFPEESFQGDTWNVQGTLDALDGMNAIEPVVVVGIQPRNRETEYTAEGWEAYGRFIVESLKPLVDTRGRTLPGPGHTVVMGSSLGGLVSLCLAWNWPKTFGGAGCLSGTFGHEDEMFQRIAREPRRPIRVYLDSGHPRDNFESTLAMRDLLLRKGFRWGDDLLHFVHPGAKHTEAAWALRLHLPLQFFFGRGAIYA